MNKFFIFLKTLLFSHYNVLATLFVILFIAYTFNDSVNIYQSIVNLDDNDYVYYSSVLYNLTIVLTGCLISYFFYHLIKNDNLPGLVVGIQVYCVVMVFVLLLMLICQNEIRIDAGFGSLTTPLNGVFHYLRDVPANNNTYIKDSDILKLNDTFSLKVI